MRNDRERLDRLAELKDLIECSNLKSHHPEEIFRAFSRGKAIWSLDSGISGHDDLLIYPEETEENEVRADLMAHFDLDEWPGKGPNKWTLTRHHDGLITHHVLRGGPATGGTWFEPRGRRSISEASDYDLSVAMKDPDDPIAAEWRRRYPERPCGNKSWAQSADSFAWRGRG